MMGLENLFRKKNVEEIIASAEREDFKLKKSLGAIDLMAMGVGAIIGAGIFVITGSIAAGGASHIGAGPAVIISFIIAAVACSFSALCYAEFASLLPISGSAYTYSYATLGEVFAWIIGWDLILEYMVGGVFVAIGWAGYFKHLLAGFGIVLPAYLSNDLRTAATNPEVMAQVPQIAGIHLSINLPAVIVVAFITVLLIMGIKESAKLNNIIVALKIIILAVFIGAGIFYIKPENWSPFAPNGWHGIFTGASLVFIAYIGFDAVSTTAEETKNPGRDLPIGIIGSLIICTILYIVVAAVMTGIAPYKILGTPEPMATALNYAGLTSLSRYVVSVGAVIALLAVLLVLMVGQPRIFFSMSRDGFLPSVFAKVHPKYRTPYVTTILTGCIIGFFAGIVDIHEAAELCNIGTLFAFALVGIAVIILRYKSPHLKRPFKVPFVPLVPILGIGSCIFLMANLVLVAWIRFIVWLAIGLIIYFIYGIKHTKYAAIEQKTD
ncbi:MAG: amino acid permease [Candidatus Eremiobacterota bacterium]